MHCDATNETNVLPPAGARVLVAMSGGVDSVAAAALLTRAGYVCMGATLRMTGEPPTKSVFEPCCGIQAVEDARRVCDRLNIEHRTVRIVEEFDRHIIAHFAAQYAAGLTPNPCIRCNRMIKFGLLYAYAKTWGFDYIAMGHYARLSIRGGRMALRRSTHRPKDQSYVLAPLTQPQLRRACFPLGEMSKDAARAVAAEVDPATGAKAESQEICFVADRNYARIVEARHGPATPGNIVDIDGNVLGRHKGIYHYTIGQRRGLGISAPQPLYVIAMDTVTNTLVVGRDEQSLCASFTTGPVFRGALAPDANVFRALVQLRYRHTPVPGTVTITKDGAEIELETPQRAVTPGQWAVFYDPEDYVLAAATIRSFVLPK